MRTRVVSRVTKFCVSDKQNHDNQGTCRDPQDFTRTNFRKYFCAHSLCTSSASLARFHHEVSSGGLSSSQGSYSFMMEGYQTTTT